MKTHLEMLFTGCCSCLGLLLPCWTGLPAASGPTTLFQTGQDCLHFSRGTTLAPSLFTGHCGSFGDFRGCWPPV